MKLHAALALLALALPACGQLQLPQTPVKQPPQPGAPPLQQPPPPPPPQQPQFQPSAHASLQPKQPQNQSLRAQPSPPNQLQRHLAVQPSFQQPQTQLPHSHASSPRQPGPALIDETTRWSKCWPTNQTIYDFSVEELDGEFIDLNQYRGQTLMIVNVASFCAFTQQYADFNPLLNENANFRIAAFPCNQFGLQEPAENHEILNGLMHVRPGNGWRPHDNLHIFGKLGVNGERQHPLYEFLKSKCPPTINEIGKRDELHYDPVRADDITWSFEKFLVDKWGRPRFRFHPTVWSHGSALKSFIAELLDESMPANYSLQ